MGSLPSLTQLFSQVPLLGVPNVNPQQWADIGACQQVVNAVSPQYGAGSATLQGAAGGQGPATSSLESFLGAPGTPSSATNAALSEFRDITAPEVMQQAVLQGQGNSGAATDALARAQEAALVPFMQGDLANTLSASNTLFGGALTAGQGLTGAGLGQEQAQIAQIQQALTAAGVPYQVAQQQAQALYNQQAQQFQFAQDIQTGPISGFPNLIGQLQNLSGVSTTTPKF